MSQETPDDIAARLAAADLAAGVSHEVSNALSAIIGWARVAQERPDKAPPAEALALIEKSARVARGATEDLLRMVRGHAAEAEDARADLSTVVEDVVRLLRPDAQHRHVGLTVQTEPHSWIDATRSQLFSIVWNLAHNAVHVVPHGGSVHVSCRRRQGVTVLEVRDDGPGMSDELKQKAFDRYYTTREGGTGIGLSIVQSTVDALHGQIKLETSPGSGTHFRIELPSGSRIKRSGEVRKPDQPRSALTTIAPTAVRVLVVEDDEGVRGLIGTTLELCGVNVITAASLKEARGIDDAELIALVDLTLPDGRGDALLSELKQAGRLIAGGIMSGAPPPADMHEGCRPDEWLRKPFDPGDLVACVKRLIDRADQPAASAAG